MENSKIFPNDYSFESCMIRKHVLEDTPGFEDYREELANFRVIWLEEREAEVTCMNNEMAEELSISLSLVELLQTMQAELDSLREKVQALEYRNED